jgi:uncharacterized membrane protein
MNGSKERWMTWLSRGASVRLITLIALWNCWVAGGAYGGARADLLPLAAGWGP